MEKYLSIIASYAILWLSISCGQPQNVLPSHPEHGFDDPLASWKDGEAKEAILDFVRNTTDSTHTDFVPKSDRIACFDNDGTLWSEQPIYFQLAFVLDEIKRKASQHPEWKTQQPFQAVLEDDHSSLMASGEKGLAHIMAESHSGMTAAEYDASVKAWLAIATHPVTGKKYDEMVFQPMLELLEFLRSNGYKTFIVSGGGIDFMRAWVEEAYGIPPYQVVGSMGGYEYRFSEGEAHLQKLPEMVFNDDKAAKPIGIHRAIGKIPLFAAGNSDGDFKMLQYTTAASGPRFGMLIHHTDSIREFAYDRDGHIGVLNKGLDSAAIYNWQVVDMAKDWKQIFPNEDFR
jgi:phosphoserine phosphatase